MKNALVLLFAILLITSCTKQGAVQEPVDKFNGYSRYLKCGEKTQDLKDKSGNKIGTIKSGIDADANFYVKYDCSTSGKKLEKSNMYAGDKKDMPISKPDDPKEDHFTKSQDHGDGECTYTYKVPLTELPHCDEPGFVYAAHCKVKDSDGHSEDAWADCGKEFNDKGCGSYDDDYNLPENQFTIIYGISYSLDSLKLYNINITTGVTTLILKEYVGNTAGTYDGAAFNVDSSLFYFANITTRELWVNNLTDNAPSFLAGTLNGTVKSGTFNNDAYYYVNADLNTINKVTFTPAWQIATETAIDTIPSTIVVNDIAMSPDGLTLFLVGEVNGGATELIKWDATAELFYSISLNIVDGTQIAYGSDGVLYAVAPVIEGGSTSAAYIVNTSTGTMTVIEDSRIIIDEGGSDPKALTDIATGSLF